MIPLNEKLSALQPSAIRSFTALAKQTPGCVLLTLGEPDFDTPQPIKDALCDALKAGQTHYAPNAGTQSLRSAIADYETSRGYCCTAEDVLVTVGATGALYTALTGILNPGDEVVVPTPAFPLYESIVKAAGASYVPMDTSKDGFQLTGETLSAHITSNTKAIVLNSPNNPTGVVYSRASLEAVKAAVLGKPIFVICDNVYGQLAKGDCPDLSCDPQLKEQILLCQSFSKPYAMTGWRAGYLAAPAWAMERLRLLHAANVACVPTFVQAACQAALKTDVSAMAESYAARRGYVCSRLEKMGLSFPKPEGAFYVFAKIPEADSTQFCTRLIREAKVALVPGSCFGAEGYVRISCCCSEAALRTGMDRLEQFIKERKV